MKFIKNLKKPILIACYDAGASNIIIHWLKEINNIEFNFHLDGPALKLFKKQFPNLVNQTLKKAIQKSNSLISGTGWQSELEHKARLEAKFKQIKSIAVIDHWVNYKERFNFNNVVCLPDEIWTTDKMAFNIASKLFKKIIIKQFKNLYLENEVKLIKKLRASHYSCKHEMKNVLYVLEPITVKWKENEKISGEFQALNFFVKNLNALKLNKKKCKIFLRLHPSEKRSKYDKWINKNKHLKIELTPHDEDLNLSIARASWVVGCNTFAMVVALKANINVASSLPIYGPECDLPYKKILKIKHMKTD